MQRRRSERVFGTMPQRNKEKGVTKTMPNKIIRVGSRESVLAVAQTELVMETIRKIEQYTGIDVAMLKILVKLMGITYVAEFASGICKDAGFSAIGSQIEMFAKFSIMAVSVPVLLTLLETIEGLLSTWK